MNKGIPCVSLRHKQRLLQLYSSSEIALFGFIIVFAHGKIEHFSDDNNSHKKKTHGERERKNGKSRTNSNCHG